MFHIIYLVEFNFERGCFVALSPKCYFAYDADSGTQKIGTKGVPHNANLTIQQFLNKLYHNESVQVTVRGFRMRQELCRVTQQKSGLSDLYCKFPIADDKISCSPLTFNNEYM